MNKICLLAATITACLASPAMAQKLGKGGHRR
jgi:hypothetical protein